MPERPLNSRRGAPHTVAAPRAPLKERSLAHLQLIATYSQGIAIGEISRIVRCIVLEATTRCCLSRSKRPMPTTSSEATDYSERTQGALAGGPTRSNPPFANRYTNKRLRLTSFGTVGYPGGIPSETKCPQVNHPTQEPRVAQQRRDDGPTMYSDGQPKRLAPARLASRWQTKRQLKKMPW